MWGQDPPPLVADIICEQPLIFSELPTKHVTDREYCCPQNLRWNSYFFLSYRPVNSRGFVLLYFAVQGIALVHNALQGLVMQFSAVHYRVKCSNNGVTWCIWKVEQLHNHRTHWFFEHCAV